MQSYFLETWSAILSRKLSVGSDMLVTELVEIPYTLLDDGQLTDERLVTRTRTRTCGTRTRTTTEALLSRTGIRTRSRTGTCDARTRTRTVTKLSGTSTRTRTCGTRYGSLSRGFT